MSSKYGKISLEDHHLSGEQLLMLVDGELASAESTDARRHLETCWTCRAELEKIEETISDFVEFRKRIQSPLLAPPPGGWAGFSQRLAGIEGWEQVPERRWFASFAVLSPLKVRLGLAGVATLLIAVLLWQSVAVRDVSAAALIDRAVASQVRDIGVTSEPVVYQKIRIRSGDRPPLGLELWNETNGRRTKQSVSGAKPGETADMLRDLSEILRRNGLDPSTPLSPSAFRQWRDSLADKTDEIVRAGETISLRTVNNGAAFEGEIAEAAVSFRASDYHIFSQSLRVRAADGGDVVDRTYEITEETFEVVSLASLKPNFFDPTPTTNDTAAALLPPPPPSPSPSASKSPEGESLAEASQASSTVPGTAKPSATTAAAAAATADLEVEVLQLLSNAGADLGEQIDVRLENGILHVRGLVESPERKAEILKSLQSVSQNPAVRIELETIAEAVARTKPAKAAKPTSVEELQTKSLESAAQNELVRHFGSEAAAKRFAADAVARSNQAITHVYALRRLARQFSPADLKTLSPDARTRLRGVIAQHARGFRRESEALSRQLSEVFGSFAGGGGGSASIRADSVEDLSRAVEALFELASANDRTVRSALTISAGESRFSALRAPQFRQSLRSAAALAERLESIK